MKVRCSFFSRFNFKKEQNKGQINAQNLGNVESSSFSFRNKNVLCLSAFLSIKILDYVDFGQIRKQDEFFF